jgi:glutaredoxin-like protein
VVKLKNIANALLLVIILTSLILLAGGRQTSHGEVLAQKDRDRIADQLSDLTGQVKMVMFTQQLECQYCAQTRGLLEELAAMSEQLSLTVFDFVQDREEVERYGIDKIPATVLMAEQDVGIRYYGVPAGYELTTLVETIQELSRGATGLAEEVTKKLEELSQDVHIQVFVTPTCPYCPAAVRTAYQLAQEHPRVRADGVEVVEFPHLGNKYHVRGVPMVVINENTSFVGARSEEFFIEQIREALQKEKEE